MKIIFQVEYIKQSVLVQQYVHRFMKLSVLVQQLHMFTD